MKYRCETKCFHNGRLYDVGDPYESKPGEKVPRHFKPLPEIPVEDSEQALEDYTKPQLAELAKDKYNLILNVDELKKTEMITRIKAVEREPKRNLPGQSEKDKKEELPEERKADEFADEPTETEEPPEVEEITEPPEVEETEKANTGKK